MKKVTVITGASSGIGAALAKQLAAEGQLVALVARRRSKLDELVDDIQTAGGVASAFVADVSDPAQVSRVFEDIAERLGEVSTLVANAGIGDPTPAHRFRSDTFEKIVRVNLLGVAYCVEALLPQMLERGSGHIVGVGSLAGYRGLPGASAYCASKAGLASFLESLRIELQGTGVRVTTICPGFVKTPLTDRNHHPMPFLMDVDDAVMRMSRAIQRQVSEYAFPWPLALPVRLAKFIPNWLYDRVLRNQNAIKDPWTE